MCTARNLAALTFIASVYAAVYGLHAESATVLGMSSFGALISFHAMCGLSLG